MLCQTSRVTCIDSSMIYINYLALRLVFLNVVVWIFLLTEEAESCNSHSLGMVAVNSSCGCEGDTLIYSCTVSGGVSTVWQGSAFDNCRITLLHSHFASGRRSSGTCNHGRIAGQSEHYSINYSNNASYYTSYVRVIATSNLNNTDIQCLHHIDSQLIPIESYNISIISEYALSPPNDIYLSQVNYSHISFAWTPLISHCQLATYFIYTYNCGECPNLVTGHIMTCVDMAVDGSICSVQIQRTACNFTGKNSSTFSILPTQPKPPNVTVTSHYYTNNLTWLKVQISSDSASQEQFRQNAHTIDYVDAKSGYKCASSTIEASSCHGNKCISFFELPSSFCNASTELNVSVFTNNSFGAGEASQPTTIYRFNRFLNVTFDSMSGAIVCNFHEEYNSPCHIEYGVCNNQSMARLTLRNNLSGTIQIPEPTHYCYSVYATYVGNTIVVHGEFYYSKTLKLNNSQTINRNILLTIIYALASTVVVSLIAVLFVVIISCIYVCSRLKNNNRIREFSSPIYDDLQDVKETTICADKNVAYSTS